MKKSFIIGFLNKRTFSFFIYTCRYVSNLFSLSNLQQDPHLMTLGLIMKMNKKKNSPIRKNKRKKKNREAKSSFCFC